MEASVALGVGVWFVTTVDDRSAPGGRRREPFPDVLRSLRDREHRASWRLQDLAGTREDLPGYEKWNKRVSELLELSKPRNEVVLMAAIRVTRRVSVVLEQVDLTSDPLF